MLIVGVKSEGRNGDASDIVEFMLSDVKYISLCKPTKNSASLPLYHTAKGSYFPLHTIKDIAKSYRKHGFRRYDRSTVINLKHIKRVHVLKSGTFVEFFDGQFVPISRRSRY